MLIRTRRLSSSIWRIKSYSTKSTSESKKHVGNIKYDTLNSLRIGANTRVIFQGLTGRQATHTAQESLAWGTKVVGGTKPGFTGEHIGLPVLPSVREAVKELKPDATAIFVPGNLTAKAIEEAIDAEVPLIVAVAEHVPPHDMLRVHDMLKVQSKSRLVGPNSPGIISVHGRCRIGFQPLPFYTPGKVGIIAKSGTLSYEAVASTTRAGLGQTLCIGIGGDFLPGTDIIEALEVLVSDDQTEAIILIGELGGDAEYKAAKWIQDYHKDEARPKPIAGLVAGMCAPEYTVMGHAGAIHLHGDKTVEQKRNLLAQYGVSMVNHPEDFGEVLKARLLEREQGIPVKSPGDRVMKEDEVEQAPLQSWASPPKDGPFASGGQRRGFYSHARMAERPLSRGIPLARVTEYFETKYSKDDRLEVVNVFPKKRAGYNRYVVRLGVGIDRRSRKVRVLIHHIGNETKLFPGAKEMRMFNLPEPSPEVTNSEVSPRPNETKDLSSEEFKALLDAKTSEAKREAEDTRRNTIAAQPSKDHPEGADALLTEHMIFNIRDRARWPTNTEKPLTLLLKQLLRVFYKTGAIRVEIDAVNDLARRSTKGRWVLARDLTITPENAAILPPDDWADPPPPREEICYVRLDGFRNIGTLVNGAGLAMNTIDALDAAGGRATNFLDTGGKATKETIKRSFQMILADDRVKAIFVNIFGGITKGDVIAEGILLAFKELDIKVPVVARIRGTNEAEGQRIIAESGLPIYAFDSFKDAAAKVISFAGAETQAHEQELADKRKAVRDARTNAYKERKLAKKAQTSALESLTEEEMQSELMEEQRNWERGFARSTRFREKKPLSSWTS